MSVLECIGLGKRFGSADEVANIVSALASDQFAYVTGQVFVLDGGLSL
ncbi:SDR family oxidoreductase [Fibrobacter sp.]